MSIKVTKLNHIYDKGMPTEQAALVDISFEVNDGEIVGIIGHTGSGKSTLLQHLNGLLKATSGSIEIGGVDIMSVAKDVAYGPKNLGLTEEEIDERVREAIALVGLDYDKVADRSPFELSGGQKRAVAIAGVVAMKPEVLILDEPTAGLDPKTHKDVLGMIKEVHERTGNITILVSHNMGDIAEMADKVIVIDSGKLVTMGTPQEVFSKGDLLKSVGLDLPPITEFCNEIGINDTVLSLDEAVGKIVDLIKE